MLWVIVVCSWWMAQISQENFVSNLFRASYCLLFPEHPKPFSTTEMRTLPDGFPAKSSHKWNLIFQMYSLHLTFVYDTIIFHSLAECHQKPHGHIFIRKMPSRTDFVHLISHLIQNENTYKIPCFISIKSRVFDDDDIHLHIPTHRTEHITSIVWWRHSQISLGNLYLYIWSHLCCFTQLMTFSSLFMLIV